MCPGSAESANIMSARVSFWCRWFLISFSFHSIPTVIAFVFEWIIWRGFWESFRFGTVSKESFYWWNHFWEPFEGRGGGGGGGRRRRTICRGGKRGKEKIRKSLVMIAYLSLIFKTVQFTFHCDLCSETPFHLTVRRYCSVSSFAAMQSVITYV